MIKTNKEKRNSIILKCYYYLLLTISVSFQITTIVSAQSYIYHLSLTGTRSSGASVIDEWSNANCYNNLHDIFSQMSGGDIIIINDGVYTGSQNVINSNYLPPNGITDFYTTIKARNIGKVIFDGENVRQMVDIQANGDPITNSLLFDGAFRGIWSAVGNDYNAMFDVDEIDYLWTSPGVHSYCEDNSNAIDPISGTPGNGIPALKYPIKIEDGSNLDGTASDNGDRGATILNKIGIDGSLWGDQGYNEISEESLWPFPNEDLIKQTMQSYSYDNGNLTGNRGFADSTAKQRNGIDDVTLTSYIWEYLGNPIPCEIYNTCEIPAPRYVITAFIYTDNGQMRATTGQDQYREIIMVEKGDDVALNFSSNEGFISKMVYVDGVETSVEGNSYTFFNVQNNHTLAVGFFDSLNGNSYTITSHSGSGGVIVPSGKIYVKEGYNAIFYAVPDIGHNVEELIIDGVDLSSHTEGNILFQNVDDHHEIHFGFNAERRYAYKTIDDINLWKAGDLPPENTINPNNLKYMGSFKLPQNSNGYPFGYGAPIAYNPNGNSSSGEADYPGSLFFLEGNVNHVISEISIPTPIISENKDENILNTAEIIRPFVKIDTGIDDTEPIVGLEYITSQSKLFFGGGRISYGDADRPNIGWIDDTFENIAGLWHVGSMTPYQYGAWTVFEIPQVWADNHTDGRSLIVGRGREGWGTGMGPSLYAIAPWQDGNPPANNTQLNYTTLLEYGNTMSQAIDLYNAVDTDFYHEGAWLEDNAKSAVVLFGTRSFGTIWYEHAHYAGHKRHVMVFFNPDDFVDVIQGKKQSYEPQPYALLDLTDYLYGEQYDDITGSQGYLTYIARTNSFLRGSAYDRKRNIIYVTEYNVLGKRHDQPIIHVFKINSDTDSVDTSSPSIPANLLCSKATSSSISLSWDASTDNIGVASYTIYRNNELLAQVSTINYSDNEVLPETTYEYYVIANDQAGNKSAQSDFLILTTPPIDLSIKLVVKETLGIDRRNEMIHNGIPIDKNDAILTTKNLIIEDASGTQIPAVFEVLSRWAGGKNDETKEIKWLLVSFPASLNANSTETFYLKTGTASILASVLTLEETNDTFRINTGSAEFVLNRQDLTLFNSISLGGNLILDENGGSFSTIHGQTKSGAKPPNEVIIERQNEHYIVIKAQGDYNNTPVGSSEHSRPLSYKIRYEFFASSPTVTISHKFYWSGRNGNNTTYISSGEVITVDNVSLILPSMIGYLSTEVYADEHTYSIGVLSDSQIASVSQKLRSLFDDPHVAEVFLGSESKETEFASKPILINRSENGSIAVSIDHMKYFEPQSIETDSNGNIAVNVLAENQYFASHQGSWARVGISALAADTSYTETLTYNYAPLNNRLFAFPTNQYVKQSNVFQEIPLRSDIPLNQYAQKYYDGLRETTLATKEWLNNKRFHGLMTWGSNVHTPCMYDTCGYDDIEG